MKAPLSEYFDVKYGRSNPGGSGDVPVVGSSGVYAKTADPLITFPTIVVGRKGSAGQAWLMETPCFPSDTTFYLEPKPNKRIDLRYVYYALRHAEIGASDDVIPSLQRNELEQIVLQIPGDEEQKKIGEVLKFIESAAALQEQLTQTIANLKMATQTKLLTEGMRGEPLKPTAIGDLPESWDAKTVGSVADPVSGGTPSKQRLDWWAGEIPWASPKDMKRLRLRDTEDHVTREAVESGSRLVPPKTIFIVIRGMILAKNVPMAIAEVPMAFNQDMKALVPTGKIDSDFLLYALCSRKEALSHEISTSAHGTRRMGSASVDQLLVPVPRDPKEQVAIAHVMHLLDRRERIAQEKLDRLRGLFSSTLDAVMTRALSLDALQVVEASNA
jgi:type I restriction enzyme S subunit